MRPVLPIYCPGPDEPEEDLVDHGGRLQDVAAPLVTHVGVGQLVELVVDEGHKRIKRGGVPFAPGTKRRLISCDEALSMTPPEKYFLPELGLILALQQGNRATEAGESTFPGIQRPFCAGTSRGKTLRTLSEGGDLWGLGAGAQF